MVLDEDFGEVSNHGAVGVNLAAINRQLCQSGGKLEVSSASTLGGSCFLLTLPLAMVVVEGMVVRVGEVQYVIPISIIQRIVREANDKIMQVSADSGRQMLRLDVNDVLPIQFLSGGINYVVNQRQIDLADSALRHLFVVVANRQYRTAIAVDELVGQQQVLIRPLQGFLSGMKGVNGCALLASGDVGMLLDMNDLCGFIDAG
jgi:two-component system chemotaxis sensor kinase CheA